MKLADALKIFLGEYKATSRRAHASTLNPMVQYIGPAKTVRRVTNADLHEFAQSLDVRPIRPATRYKHIKSIKRFFAWLVEIKELEFSPAATLKQPRPAKEVGRNKAMTDQELDEVLKVAYGDPRNHALVLFLSDTGCRAGGAATLQIDKLDLESRRAVVTEKGDKSRPVWFSEDTASALRHWLIQRPAQPGNPYVFHSDGNRSMTAPAVSQVIRRLCKKAGVRSMGSHSLRHRKGYQFSDNGVSPTIAATALGHSDPLITMIYYYPNDYARAEEAVRATHQETNQNEKILYIKWGHK